jgi:UDP-N-acetylglucosamine 2-epimerase
MMMVTMGEGRDWENPFGDGMAGERIVRILMNGKI